MVKAHPGLREESMCRGHMSVELGQCDGLPGTLIARDCLLLSEVSILVLCTGPCSSDPMVNKT